DYAATAHYFEYRIGDRAGNIDGRQGIRLADAGIAVLEVFQPKKGSQSMSTNSTQEQPEALTTKPAKSRGTLTTKAGTFDQAKSHMEQRRMRNHDQLTVDQTSNAANAKQKYSF